MRSEVRFEPSQVRKSKASELVVRFVFGGLVTAGAGAISARWGPVIGGLFLGFPGILPAAITLVKEHDGKREAAAIGLGASAGSLALVAFAVVVWKLAERFGGVATLLAASLAWLIVGALLWRLLLAGRATAALEAPGSPRSK